MGINFPVFSSEMYLKRVYISTVFLPIWLVGLGVGMKAPISAEFIANFLKWQFPLKANIFTNVGQCFTLNFGSQLNIEDLPMTTIDPYLVDQQIFQQNKTESDATNNCFLVFIGGQSVIWPQNIFNKARRSTPLTVRSSWFEGFSLQCSSS